jgi:O-acetyl-ADP-ribose deacetylase (regulator of RNase III)
MINYTKGNLLDAQTEAIVNTVNTVGVMGKGIALQFREAFPDNYKAYKRATDAKAVQIGKMFVTENHALTGPKYIINFPTKKHWRQPSRIEYITAGLQDLRRVLLKEQIRSVALPPLGCGNGGLDWLEVRQLIEAELNDLPLTHIVVYEPTKEYQNTPKKEGVEELTAARAMIVEMIARYVAIGFECSNLEIHKLAWFLHRFIQAFGLDDPLHLKFHAEKYGPYADNLRQLLNALDGSFLHCDKRLADAGPMDSISIDYSKASKASEFMSQSKYQDLEKALRAAGELIDGFETPFLMELLATVDWIQSERGRTLDTPEIVDALREWPGGTKSAKRKAALFDSNTIDLARSRLGAYERLLYQHPSHDAALRS